MAGHPPSVVWSGGNLKPDIAYVQDSSQLAASMNLGYMIRWRCSAWWGALDSEDLGDMRPFRKMCWWVHPSQGRGLWFFVFQVALLNSQLTCMTLRRGWLNTSFFWPQVFSGSRQPAPASLQVNRPPFQGGPSLGTCSHSPDQRRGHAGTCWLLIRVTFIAKQLNKVSSLPILQMSKVRVRGGNALPTLNLCFGTCPACPQSQSSLPNAVPSSLFPSSTQGLFGVSSQCRVTFLLQVRHKLQRAHLCSLGEVLSWIWDVKFGCKAGSVCSAGSNAAWGCGVLTG